MVNDTNDKLLDMVTVIIPTRDEVKGIGLVLNEAISVGVPKNRIFVVDGGSKDGTADVAMKYGVKVILQVGEGKAAAIWTALKYVDTPYMLIMDGDYSYPAKYIPTMVEEVTTTRADEVIGVRIPLPGSQGFIYRLGNKLLTWIFNLLFDTRLHDVLSGMYIVRVDSLRDAVAEVGGLQYRGAHSRSHD